jgi:hypothetical protein
LFSFYYENLAADQVNAKIAKFIPTLTGDEKTKLIVDYDISKYAYPGVAFGNFIIVLLPDFTFGKYFYCRLPEC